MLDFGSDGIDFAELDFRLGLAQILVDRLHELFGSTLECATHSVELFDSLADRRRLEPLSVGPLEREDSLDIHAGALSSLEDEPGTT